MKELIAEIKQIIAEGRSYASKSINSLQVVSNYLVGKRIVEHELAGESRAEDGKETLKNFHLFFPRTLEGAIQLVIWSICGNSIWHILLNSNKIPDSVCAIQSLLVSLCLFDGN